MQTALAMRRLRIELLDDAFQPIIGFSGEKSAVVKESSLRAPVVWANGRSAEVNGPYRIRIAFEGKRAENIKLYGIYAVPKTIAAEGVSLSIGSRQASSTKVPWADSLALDIVTHEHRMSVAAIGRLVSVCPCDDQILERDNSRSRFTERDGIHLIPATRFRRQHWCSIPSLSVITFIDWRPTQRPMDSRSVSTARKTQKTRCWRKCNSRPERPALR